MHKQFIIEVESVNGYCSCGYKVGDRFTAQRLDTPTPCLCGGAYTILFPVQFALSSGAAFRFEQNPHSKTKLACPDNGHVVFTITQLDE